MKEQIKNLRILGQAKNIQRRSEFKPILDEFGNPLPKSERKPKRKCAVLFGYCGSGYNGLQVQNDENIKTIESDLYKALYKAGAISLENSIDQKKSGFQRAARTDKGVHAAGNVISLKMIIEDEDLISKINDNLPQQIRIWNIQRTTKSFDCRKMCSSRIYEYLLPTYSLLPPKPNTFLSNLIKEAKEKNPDLFISNDEEGEGSWWDQPEIKSQLESNSSNKKFETQLKRSYRINSTRFKTFQDIMKKYQGTNNFHNFTIGKSFNDNSSKRFIMDCKCSDPFVINGTEWISIKIHGQSFMLHQIRKMICMATLLIRCDLPSNLIYDFFKIDKINIPKAPSLGLLLEQPVYNSFNNKLKNGIQGYDSINFNKFELEINEFKMKFIYDKIYNEEINENVFNAFYNYIDSFKINNDQEENEKENENNNNITIFDFITNYIDKHDKKSIE